MKFKHLIICIFICIFAYLHICILSNIAYADFSLGVYPPILQVNATPPTSIHTQVTVSNLSNVPVNLHLEIKPFHPSLDQNGTITFFKKNEDTLWNDPLILQKIELTNSDNSPITDSVLSPNAEKTVYIHIAIPKDEPDGDYYLSMVFSSLINSNSNNGITSSLVTGSIASNLLLSINNAGGANASGSISEFSTPWFTLKGPVNFKVAVQNTGSHFTAPKGVIVITNIFNQIVGNIPLVPVNVLANSTRFIPGEDGNTVFDNFSTQIPVSTWKEKNIFGIYTATLKLALSNEGPLFVKSINFTALPIEAILGIIFISLLIAWMIVRIKTKLSESNK